MITPTVGRVVWVRGRPSAIDKDEPEVGLVVYVHSINCINVVGFDANGAQFVATSLMLKQDDPTADSWLPNFAGFYAEWMPYQKGQAAKTEALEAAAGKSA